MGRGDEGGVATRSSVFTVGHVCDGFDSAWRAASQPTPRARVAMRSPRWRSVARGRVGERMQQRLMGSAE
eukprot:4598419-Lingulodinium_polyedra.AAC.1